MKVLVAMEVGRKMAADPQRPPVDGWGLEMPVGARIVRVGMAKSLQAMVLMTPNAPVVWHPLLIMPVGGHYNPTLGRQVGECFGVVQQGPLAFGIFADAPWPTSTLEAVAAGGAA